MSYQQSEHTFTDREFFARVRAKLDAGGHHDIAFSRLWIDTDTPGEPYLVHVPVGTELRVPLRFAEDLFHARGAEIEFHVDYTAMALVNLVRAERVLVKYARDVRRSANEAIATARADGLDILLEAVGFKPTYAKHLSGLDWKSAASYVLASIRVRHTSFYLRQEVSEIVIEEPSDFAEELETFRQDQLERQALQAEMDRVGADLVVDSTTLDLLGAHGQDVTEVLREVWKKQCFNLAFQHNGRGASLSVHTGDGVVSSSLNVDGALAWNGEYLWFLGDDSATGYGGLVGKCLGDLVDHPVFATRPIMKVDASPGGSGRELIHFDQSEVMLFDADTGRLWRPEQLAA